MERDTIRIPFLIRGVRAFEASLQVPRIVFVIRARTRYGYGSTDTDNDNDNNNLEAVPCACGCYLPNKVARYTLGSI